MSEWSSKIRRLRCSATVYAVLQFYYNYNSFFIAFIEEQPPNHSVYEFKWSPLYCPVETILTPHTIFTISWCSPIWPCFKLHFYKCGILRGNLNTHVSEGIYLHSTVYSFGPLSGWSRWQTHLFTNTKQVPMTAPFRMFKSSVLLGRIIFQ